MFTPSGSLLATGTSPTAPDAKKSRTYSALAANIWSAYERVAVQGVIEQSLPTASLQSDESSSSSSPPPESAAIESAPNPNPNSSAGLKSLTLELSDYNLHIQLVAPRVLLCLIGPKQPTRHTSSSSSLHSQEDKDKDKDKDRDRDTNNKSTPPGSAPRTAVASVASAQGAMGSLGILKTQAQALVDYLEKELRGFELPDGI